ncbi:unnamed protein product [Ectocarpus sp. CCAP 1310/34]|nr:unnamed protein product [Ectocarpus sp. CCAP 1310/34]
MKYSYFVYTPYYIKLRTTTCCLLYTALMVLSASSREGLTKLVNLRDQQELSTSQLVDIKKHLLNNEPLSHDFWKGIEELRSLRAEAKGIIVFNSISQEKGRAASNPPAGTHNTINAFAKGRGKPVVRTRGDGSTEEITNIDFAAPPQYLDVEGGGRWNNVFWVLVLGCRRIPGRGGGCDV